MGEPGDQQYFRGPFRLLPLVDTVRRYNDRKRPKLP